MGLMERVSTLVRANLNDLIDRAENPSTMIKQVILDVENQLLQVKTQVAISIADQHMLEQKAKESGDASAEWLRKAELAVGKGHDDLARAALERHKHAERIARNFLQQVDDQRTQVATLKTALLGLEQKLAEARAKSDVLLAQRRRARAMGRAADARIATVGRATADTYELLQHRAAVEDAIGRAKADIAAADVEDRLAQLQRDDEVDRLLAELKTKRGRT